MPVMSDQVLTPLAGDNVASTGYTYSAWYPAKVDKMAVQYTVATLTRSGTVQFRLEGKLTDGIRPASIDTQSFSSVEDIDQLTNLTNPIVQEVRIGVRSSVQPASPLASPCNVYSTLLLREYV